MNALSAAVATALGSREGHVNSSDGYLEAALRLSKEMGGPGGAGLPVELEGCLEAVSPEEALPLMHPAHEVCPYSNATRGNIDVKLSVR